MTTLAIPQTQAPASAPAPELRLVESPAMPAVPEAHWVNAADAELLAKLFALGMRAVRFKDGQLFVEEPAAGTPSVLRTPAGLPEGGHFKCLSLALEENCRELPKLFNGGWKGVGVTYVPAPQAQAQGPQPRLSALLTLEAPTRRLEPAVTTRLLGTGDVERVWEIYRAVYGRLKKEEHGYFIAPKPREYFEESIAAGRLIGAEVGGVLAGFGHLGLTTPEQPDSGVGGMERTYNPTRTGVLCSVMVDAAHRGHKLGRHLIASRVQLARRLGLEDCVTMVCTNNPESWRNLVSGGFVVTQAGIDASDGSQVLYMRRRLWEGLGEVKPTTPGFSPWRKPFLVEPHAGFEKLRRWLAAGHRSIGHQGNALILDSEPQ